MVFYKQCYVIVLLTELKMEYEDKMQAFQSAQDALQTCKKHIIMFFFVTIVLRRGPFFHDHCFI